MKVCREMAHEVNYMPKEINSCIALLNEIFNAIEVEQKTSSSQRGMVLITLKDTVKEFYELSHLIVSLRFDRKVTVLYIFYTRHAINHVSPEKLDFVGVL